MAHHWRRVTPFIQSNQLLLCLMTAFFISPWRDKKIVLDDNHRLLKTISEIKNGAEITVKDLGIQLSWRTVNHLRDDLMIKFSLFSIIFLGVLRWIRWAYRHLSWNLSLGCYFQIEPQSKLNVQKILADLFQVLLHCFLLSKDWPLLGCGSLCQKSPWDPLCSYLQ